LGAGCSAANCGKDGASGDDLAKALQTENAALRKEVSDATARIAGIAEAFEKRIANLEAQPVPAKAAITVTKGFDGAAGESGVGREDAQAAAQKHLESLPPQERATFLMKLAMANPVSVIR
jgi:cell division septum initiation protein DivIVA